MEELRFLNFAVQSIQRTWVWSLISSIICYLFFTIKDHCEKRGFFQVSLIRLALRLFTFRYTSVPSKILWKSCFGNCFFFPLIAESQLRKVRESKQPAYKIFGKQTFAQFFFLHKILVMRHQLLSGYFGLYPPSLRDKSGGERSLFLLKMATLVTSVN